MQLDRLIALLDEHVHSLDDDDLNNSIEDLSSSLEQANELLAIFSRARDVYIDEDDITAVYDDEEYDLASVDVLLENASSHHDDAKAEIRAFRRHLNQLARVSKLLVLAIESIESTAHETLNRASVALVNNREQIRQLDRTLIRLRQRLTDHPADDNTNHYEDDGSSLS